MCKFVNTLSGKNAQSSALGAPATARFYPNPLYALRAFFPALHPPPLKEGVGEVSKATAKIHHFRHFCCA